MRGAWPDALLAEKLAACVQLMEIESHYAWKGEAKHEAEVMLVAKTRAEMFSRVIARIKALHPYETPEIVAQDFAAGFAVSTGFRNDELERFQEKCAAVFRPEPRQNKS